MSVSQQLTGIHPPDSLSCSHCDALLPTSAIFCGSCGERVEKGKNGEQEIRTENSDDAWVQNDDTVRLPSLSQTYLKRWQSSRAVKSSIAGTWQRVPETEVPAVLEEVTEKRPALKRRITPSLPTISYIPQRNIIVNASRSNWLWPTIIILSAIAAGLVNAVFTNTAMRPAIEFWFLCVCPGIVLVRFLRLKEPVVEWTLALALSFAIDAIVAAIQLYAGRWSPTGTLSILIGFCLVMAIVQLARRVPATGIKTYSMIKAMKRLVRVRTNAEGTSLVFKPLDIILLLLPLLALFLWSISLQTISLNAMNDLGLISALSPRIIVALGILVVSFAVTLQRHQVRVSLLAFQLMCIILILYTTPNLIEEALRFAPVYRSAGYTDYIMQTGTVASHLDFYFNVPGFYVLNALFTKVAGYSTILTYAGWAPLFYNLIYAGPMYTIFTSITTNKRLVWLSLLFFYLTNWVGQDAFSPQGLNFFLYLVIIMVLLRWFRVSPKKQVQLGKDASLVQKFFVWLKAPDPQSPPIEPWQQRGLLCGLILIFGLGVFSHPLTPFFTLLSVGILVVFRRCHPFWLPILMLAMVAFWDIVMVGPYASQHYNLIKSFGNLIGNVPKSITSGKLSGDALYHVIATMRLYMTVLLWFLAFLGGIKHLRQGNRAITLALLAIAGFPLVAAQGYGGEMLMRIYFFTEPFMCLFAASLFFDNSMTIARTPTRIYATFTWRTATIIAANLFLLGTFFFTRYGDEHVDYISYGEWNAVQYLYQIAPANAFLLSAWDYSPLYFKNYAKYDIQTLASAYPETVMNTNANGVIDLMINENHRYSYIIFSQEEQVYATSYNGLPSNALQRLETSLLRTGRFKLVYRNSDAQILQFVEDRGGT